MLQIVFYQKNGLLVEFYKSKDRFLNIMLTFCIEIIDV